MSCLVRPNGSIEPAYLCYMLHGVITNNQQDLFSVILGFFLQIILLTCTKHTTRHISDVIRVLLFSRIFSSITCWWIVAFGFNIITVRFNYIEWCSSLIQMSLQWLHCPILWLLLLQNNSGLIMLWYCRTTDVHYKWFVVNRVI